jgi:hypothetical protein
MFLIGYCHSVDGGSAGFAFGPEGRSLRQTVFELTAIIGRPDPMPNPQALGRRTRPMAAPAARSLRITGWRLPAGQEACCGAIRYGPPGLPDR